MNATLGPIVVTVSTVHPGPSGGAVFTGQDASGRWIRAVANYDCMPLAPTKGQALSLIGEFRLDPLHGRQLYVSSFQQVPPEGDLLYNHLRHHPAFRGIGLGDAKIAKLRRAFGNQLQALLESSDTGSLSEVLSVALAEKLVAAWHSNSQESSVIAFLSQHRIDVRLAHRILRYWGAEAVEKLHQNPYRLLILTSWENADRVAKEIGTAPEDPIRLIAAVESATYRRLDKYRATLTDESSLRNEIRRMTGRIDEETLEIAVGLAVQERAIVRCPLGYQPVGCALMEAYIAERLKAMLPDLGRGQIDLFGSGGRNTLVDAEITRFEQSAGITLNAEQLRAVHMAATSSLSVLTGGAGVGKTTVLKTIQLVSRAMNVTVFQMALAGRAAQRMREATGQEAYTIAGFLNRLRNGQISPRPGDLVIIDESSMLDLLLAYRLIKALPKGIRLLFVGDPYQLPPIGPGLVFHVLANSPSVPSTELIAVHRQTESTGIPQIAQEVRRGVVPDLPKYGGLRPGVTFIECAQQSVIDLMVDVVRDLGGFHNTQILGVVKSGPAGVNNINRVFHKLLTKDRPRLAAWSLAEADPVIYTTNDYERELFNGTLGRVETVFPDGDGTRRATVNFDGRMVELSDDELGNTELAYAITVHKSQGSAFSRVVIPITRSRLLDRTLVYTALTRGIEQVVFVGDRGEFCAAVETPPSADTRQVGFSI